MLVVSPKFTLKNKKRGV